MKASYVRYSQLPSVHLYKMNLWTVCTILATFLLNYADSDCSNTPCSQTDYRSYSNCISNQCPKTVVATGCSESSCSSVNCNTCSGSSSNTCCNTCCKQIKSCECSAVDCNSCQGYGSCCQSCCNKQQADCCQNNRRQQCCSNNPSNSCCQTPPTHPPPTFPPYPPYPPYPPVSFPNITFPNITIFINQTPAIITNNPNYNLNQTCGSVVTERNETHIIMTTGNCTETQRQICCTILSRFPCQPLPYPPFSYCPPPIYNTVCGPQCPQIHPPPYTPTPIYQPQYIPPPIQPQMYLPPPPIQPQMYLPPPPIQSQMYLPPPSIQPQIYIPPPTYIPQYVPPIRVPGCYVNYPAYSQCPSYCLGGCSVLPGFFRGGCTSVNQWPYLRCPPSYGGGEISPYSGGNNAFLQYSANVSPQYVGSSGPPQYVSGNASPQYVGNSAPPQFGSISASHPYSSNPHIG